MKQPEHKRAQELPAHDLGAQSSCANPSRAAEEQTGLPFTTPAAAPAPQSFSKVRQAAQGLLHISLRLRLETLVLPAG